ncbi:MAG: ANTAR domain-containing protein [candidate division WOR-3 bacterium]
MREDSSKIIVKVLEILNNSRDLSQMLNYIAISVCELIGADSCFIYLYDKDNNELILMGSSSINHKAIGRIKLSLGEGLAGLVGKERKIISISKKAYKDKRFKVFRNLKEDTYEAIISVPIIFGDNLVGVINAQHKNEHKYTKAEKNLLEMFSKLISGALERDWLYEQYKKKAEILENILDSILDENGDIVQRLESIIFKILKKPVKVVQDVKIQSDIKSKYFSVILSEGYITDEQRKAISLILNQADLIIKNKKLKDEIEERKLVERAKGILMKYGMSEEEAYNYIRRKAMDTRKTIKEIAESIVILKEVKL